MGGPDERIRAKIRTQGRISVHDFVAEALYGEGGYYRQERDPVGPRGDFYTSARVHPAFAALLAVQIAQLWGAWGQPGTFDVCEVGGGHGTLATDLGHALADFSPALARAVRLTVVDWAGGLPDDAFERLLPGSGLPAGLQGVVVANELLDALPICRVHKLDGEIRELFLVPEGDSLVERPFAIATAGLEDLVAEMAQQMPEGTIAEVQPAIVDWMERLAAALERGVAVLFDYADEREALWRRSKGTLRGFRRHRLVDDPYSWPGQTDLTCHVDLATVRGAARRAGLAILGEVSQAEFLANLGMARIREALAEAPLDPAARQANLAALDDLVSPGGLGGFRVVVLGKNAGDRGLVGLEGGGEPAAAPVLTRRHMTLW